MIAPRQEVPVVIDYLIALQVLGSTLKTLQIPEELAKHGAGAHYLVTRLRLAMAEVDRARPRGVPALLQDDAQPVVPMIETREREVEAA